MEIEIASAAAAESVGYKLKAVTVLVSVFILTTRVIITRQRLRNVVVMSANCIPTRRSMAGHQTHPLCDGCGLRH